MNLIDLLPVDLWLIVMQYSGIYGERITFGIPSLREYLGHILAKKTIQHNKLVYKFYNMLVSRWSQKDSVTYLFGSTLSDSLTNKLCVSKPLIRITELNFFTNLSCVFVQESIKDVVSKANGTITNNPYDTLYRRRDCSYNIRYGTSIFNVTICIACDCDEWTFHFKCKTLVSNCESFKKKCKEKLDSECYPENKTCYQIIPTNPSNRHIVYDARAYMHIRNREREALNEYALYKLCEDCKVWKCSIRTIDLLIKKTIKLPQLRWYDDTDSRCCIYHPWVPNDYLSILFQHIICWGNLDVLEKIYKRLYTAWLVVCDHINKFINRTFRQLSKELVNNYYETYHQMWNTYTNQYIQIVNNLNDTSFPRYLHVSRGIDIRPRPIASYTHETGNSFLSNRGNRCRVCDYCAELYRGKCNCRFVYMNTLYDNHMDLIKSNHKRIKRKLIK